MRYTQIELVADNPVVHRVAGGTFPVCLLSTSAVVDTIGGGRASFFASNWNARHFERGGGKGRFSPFLSVFARYSFFRLIGLLNSIAEMSRGLGSESRPVCMLYALCVTGAVKAVQTTRRDRCAFMRE